MTATQTKETVVRLPTVGVRPEVVTALEVLSATTGLSMSHHIRAVLTEALVEMGLLAEPDLQPTQPRGPRKRRS
jgi:hypothetical protein